MTRNRASGWGKRANMLVTRRTPTTRSRRPSRAELDGSHRPWTWRHWHLVVDLASGRRTVLDRAWDDTAAQQPGDPAALWNPKGYANTSWARAELTVT